MCAPDGDWNPFRVFVPLSPCFAVRVRGRFFLHSCLDKERLGQPCGCVCSTAEEEEGAIGGVRVRRGRERRREEGGARAGPCVRVSERVWRGEKKKGSDGELAAFCPRNRQPRCYFSCGRYQRQRPASSAGLLPPTHQCLYLFFAWFYDFRCSVIPDAIGSISKVKPSFVEASARRAPPCRQEPEGLFTVWIRPGRSKLCHRDFSQPPQLVFFFCFFFLCIRLRDFFKNHQTGG